MTVNDIRPHHNESTPRPLLLTIPQAARMLAIGRSTLYELIAAHQLATVHIGRAVRIPLDEVRSFVIARAGAVAPKQSPTVPSDHGPEVP